MAAVEQKEGDSSVEVPKIESSDMLTDQLEYVVNLANRSLQAGRDRCDFFCSILNSAIMIVNTFLCQ